LEQFSQRFLDDYARANQQKPSGVEAKASILRVHILPALGQKPLDRITTEDIQRLKGRLGKKAPKTVNNVLTVLNVLLKTAVQWGAIREMPCTIRLLKVPRGTATFHDFESFERLVDGAKGIGGQALVVVLLGGEAGLRCGEMIALEWKDVDLGRRQLCVRRSDWNGQITAPKGNRIRYVPLTTRLEAALREHRHLRSPRVLCRADGTNLLLRHASLDGASAQVPCRTPSASPGKSGKPAGTEMPAPQKKTTLPLSRSSSNSSGIRGAPAENLMTIIVDRDVFQRAYDQGLSS
jgi:integrase